MENWAGGPRRNWEGFDGKERANKGGRVVLHGESQGRKDHLGEALPLLMDLPAQGLPEPTGPSTCFYWKSLQAGGPRDPGKTIGKQWFSQAGCHFQNFPPPPTPHLFCVLIIEWLRTGQSDGLQKSKKEARTLVTLTMARSSMGCRNCLCCSSGGHISWESLRCSLSCGHCSDRHGPLALTFLSSWLFSSQSISTCCCHENAPKSFLL